MKGERTSYRQILSSTSIMAGATGGAILIGLARAKIFALLIGPAGMGLIGIFTSVLGVVSSLAGFGISSSTVRQISSAAAQRQGAALKAAWTLAILLSFVGGVGLWAIYPWLVTSIDGLPNEQSTAAILGIGVIFTILSASQLGIFQAFRKLKILSFVKVVGALLGAILGVSALLLWKETGIAIAVVAGPLGTFSVALMLRRFVPRAMPTRLRVRQIFFEWKSLLALGGAVMVANLLFNGSQLVVRGAISDEIGLNGAGLFHAVWLISATNMNLILAAMASDYFPRLSAVANDRQLVSDLVNQQLKIALILAVPLVFLAALFSPLIMNVLYSQEFVAGSDLLSWFVIGDIFKIVGWAFGFVLVAKRDSVVYMFVESMFSICWILGVMALLPHAGMLGAGLSYILSYIMYSIVVIIVCKKRHRVNIQISNLVFSYVAAAGLASFAIAVQFAPAEAYPVGAFLLLFTITYSAIKLDHLANEGRFTKLIKTKVLRSS